jgi:hypothetical protein
VNKTQFVTELSKLHPASTFLTVAGYRNAHSEVANYSIVFHMSYQNALKRSIDMLEDLNVSGAAENFAREEVLSSLRGSFKSSISSPIESREDGYHHFKDADGNYIKGIKLHVRTNTLHLYGLVAHKRVLMPGIYPARHENPLAKAKRQLRQLTPAGKFRQFKMTPDQVEYIAVSNLTLLPPEN